MCGTDGPCAGLATLLREMTLDGVGPPRALLVLRTRASLTLLEILDDGAGTCIALTDAGSAAFLFNFGFGCFQIVCFGVKTPGNFGFALDDDSAKLSLGFAEGIGIGFGLEDTTLACNAPIALACAKIL